MSESDVGLAAAIRSLREELLAASEDGRGAPMRFGIGPVELTLQVTLAKGVDGRVGWSVAGVGGSRATETGQTLRLSLEPLWLDRDGTYITDFAIADDATGGVRFAR